MDRISELPESIIHHILSFLNTLDRSCSTELVRMSVLSKTWFHLTASFPVLDFYIDDFTCRESFFKYVEYTTSRFCHHNLPAHTLKLVTTLRDLADLDIVNRCVERLLNKGVRELVVYLSDFTNPSYDVPKYRLPNILLSVSMLESLTIRGCDLPSPLTVDAVKFKSLTQLVLRHIHINDDAIRHLTTSCPLLQIFHVDNCHGFKRFCVYGRQNLQNVRIRSCNSQLERIDIEAPYLSSLSITKDDRSGLPQMNLASCKKLKKVTYIGQPLPNLNGFTDFLSNFPFVENLALVTNYKCNNLKLSSHSLKTLMLCSQCDLEEIELNTPNLVSFSYTCSCTQLLSMVYNSHRSWLRDSTHSKACMYCYPDGCEDKLWFKKLRQFLDKKNGFKVFNLCIHTMYSQKFRELGWLKVIELPPYELEHVELQMESDEESLSHIAFVDAVLCCCRPRSLTLRSSFSFTDFEDVVKFTYKKMLEQEDQGRTNIQIVWPDGNKVCFIKEEVIQEEAR